MSHLAMYAWLIAKYALRYYHLQLQILVRLKIKGKFYEYGPLCSILETHAANNLLTYLFTVAVYKGFLRCQVKTFCVIVFFEVNHTSLYPKK